MCSRRRLTRDTTAESLSCSHALREKSLSQNDSNNKQIFERKKQSVHLRLRGPVLCAVTSACHHGARQLQCNIFRSPAGLTVNLERGSTVITDEMFGVMTRTKTSRVCSVLGFSLQPGPCTVVFPCPSWTWPKIAQNTQLDKTHLFTPRVWPHQLVWWISRHQLVWWILPLHLVWWIYPHQLVWWILPHHAVGVVNLVSPVRMVNQAPPVGVVI